jgi:hypothetical protein
MLQILSWSRAQSRFRGLDKNGYFNPGIVSPPPIAAQDRVLLFIVYRKRGKLRIVFFQGMIK